MNFRTSGKREALPSIVQVVSSSFIPFNQKLLLPTPTILFPPQAEFSRAQRAESDGTVRIVTLSYVGDDGEDGSEHGGILLLLCHPLNIV